MSAPKSPRLPRVGPAWAVTSSVAEIVVLAVTGLAAAVAIVGLIQAGAGWVGVIAPLLVLGGLALAYRTAWLGLIPVTLAPIVAALVPGLPVAVWSMVCFAAFLFALKWLPGLVVAGVLAPLNLAAAALDAGTIDVSVDPAASIFGFVALVGASAGAALKGNVRYRSETERRLRESEAARVAAVERSVAQERLRIARDLHDSVGHQVAVVNMHLGAAEVSVVRNPDAARAALRSARTALQSVLQETQQILTMLRGSQEDEPGRATPDYASIAGLVDSYRAMGLLVEASLDLLPPELPAEVNIAAYRIVQEALTNAHRYGDGDVAVTVTAADEAGGTIRIAASNRRGTRERPVSGGGNGLIGMRERAESAGGSLEVQQDSTHFRVCATLPVREGGGR